MHPGGGIIRAVALEGGRAAGTWSLRGHDVAIEAWAGVPAATWEHDAEDVVRFQRYSSGTR